MKSLLSAALFATALTGCISHMPRAEYLSRALGPKAAFDLDCPVEQLEYKNLDAPVDGQLLLRGTGYVMVKDISVQMGVLGCGRRGRYVYVKSTEQWILNSESRTQRKSPTP